MKLTVFALLLVGLAFAVLASIFRSGMKQFDQQPPSHTAMTSSVSARLGAETMTPQNAPPKKRLQPWLRKAQRPVSHQPIATEVVTESQTVVERQPVEDTFAPEVEEPAMDPAEIDAWREELHQREEALIAAEEEWLEEQARFLAAQESRSNTGPANTQMQELEAAIAERAAVLVSLRQELEANVAWLEQNSEGLEAIADTP